MKWATAQKHVALSPASRAHLLSSISLTWGLRPRLYSAARLAGSLAIFYIANLGLRPRLYSAARFAGSLAIFYIANLGLAPQALFCRPLRGLTRYLLYR
jgi:hypothetical protein